MDDIRCPSCQHVFKIDEALEGQIGARILAESNRKHAEELESVKKKAEASIREQFDIELQTVRTQSVTTLELEKKRFEAELEGKARLAALDQELLVKRIMDDAEAAKKQNTELLEQLTELTKQLSAEKKVSEEATFNAQKRLADEEAKIREEAGRSADERYELKLKQLNKQLEDTKTALTEAEKKASQGSQQNQGEVLEITLEESLRIEFPFDVIEEVKKGVRGADVKQTVRNNRSHECGTLLWETKNAVWSAGWIQKFKEDIRAANADIGILVSVDTEKHGEISNIDGVWIVKPGLALAVGNILRSQILSVYSANNNAQNKDAKMDILYQYLTGTEFRYRVEAIIDNYKILLKSLEKEKRATELRWSKQEKAISSVIKNTIGMYGDLQGITGGALSDIKQLEAEESDED
jgi:hypothetical protein